MMDKMFYIQMPVAAWCAISVVVCLGIFAAYYLGAAIERNSRNDDNIDRFLNN